ncbi:hypothetical protein D9757_005713 [Collybiopsis confluens]|uniref:Uncharacterized protein n=1 Tax=Collybiopsis confluens TaxID=2823264 RepID=A0A8H5HQ02_9AGAR|nr:hypothetical protein D9757_005713 [Collybiopsis confluens]
MALNTTYWQRSGIKRTFNAVQGMDYSRSSRALLETLTQLSSLLSVAHFRRWSARNKLSKVAAPDPFTSSSSSIKDGSRKVGENKLLGKAGTSRNRFQPYKNKCKDCKQPFSVLIYRLKAAPIRRVSVLCVASKFWTPRDTLCRASDRSLSSLSNLVHVLYNLRWIWFTAKLHPLAATANRGNANISP